VVVVTEVPAAAVAIAGDCPDEPAAVLPPA
jgi:hypothetical protein